jgi:hypothetical protein
MQLYRIDDYHQADVNLTSARPSVRTYTATTRDYHRKAHHKRGIHPVCISTTVHQVSYSANCVAPVSNPSLRMNEGFVFAP